MSRRKPSAAQLPLTERPRKPAPLARVKPRLEVVATFEPDAPKARKGESARQLARRARFRELVAGHGPMAHNWKETRAPLERFALLQWHPKAFAWISTHESPDAASDVAVDYSGETGFEAVALFDLDTGDEWAPRTRVEWELEVGGEE